MADFSHVAQSAAQSNQRTGWSTKQLVVMALFTALSLIVSFVEVPIFPAAPFLKYDPSACIAVLGGFAYGPVAGVIIGVVSAVIHGLIMGDPWGSLMTIICVVCWTVPAVLIYRSNKSVARAAVGLVVGCILAVAGAIAGNLLITPIYTGTDVATVAGMILPILLPFNVLKSIINAVISFALLKPVTGMASE